MSYPTFLSRVEREIRDERDRQDDKWGPQDHPDFDPRDIDVVLRNEYAFRARRWKEINAERAAATVTPTRCDGHPEGPHPHTGWDGVLLEEVYEALTEAAAGDEAALRAELVQTAAVVVAWLECIDRRGAARAQDTGGAQGGAQ